MKTQVMLDLETLGTRPGSAIVAIGAVKFGGNKIIDEFYTTICATSCAAEGLTMDPSTVMWWMKQPDATRLEITTSNQELKDALSGFRRWLSDDLVDVWGNGAAFDNVMLAEAYRAIGSEPPWKFWNDRCYKTVKNMHPGIPIIRLGTLHHALDDAKDQANHLMSIAAQHPSTIW